MDYSEAIAAVNAGGYAWRTSWVAQYLELYNGAVYINQAGAVSPYSPTSEDEAATDWDSGDHPPVKSK